MNDHEKHDGAGDPYSLSGAYALDAVTDEERALVEAEMRRSEALRTEVGELTDTAALLGAAVAPVTPSPELRSRLMALIETTPQIDTVADRAPEPVITPVQQQATEAAPTRSNVVRGPDAWFRRPRVLLASAAAAALIFAGGTAVGGALTSPSEQAVAFAEISTAGDRATETTQLDGGGSMEFVFSDELDASAVVFHDIDGLTDDQVLQLWHIDGDDITSAGLYDPAQGDRYRVLDGETVRGETVGVTVEPAGGSDQPSGEPIAAFVTA